MKKNNFVTNLVAVLLFLAAVVYIGVYLRGTDSGVTTVEAIEMTVQESTPATGIVVRSELIVTSPMTYAYITAADGEQISRYGRIGTAMETQADQERANQLKIESAEAALSGLIDPDDLTGLDTAVSGAVLTIASGVARGDLSELDTAQARLVTLVFENGGEGVLTEQEIGQLRTQLSGLQQSSSGGTQVITAPQAGTFSSILDGWEHLTLKDTDDLTPDGVRALIADEQPVAENAVGKLITNVNWRFAAIMDAESAWQLETGGTATLQFGRYYSYPLRATVLSISQEEDDECAVVFSINRAIAETLAMRQASAEVVYAEYSGLRVPTRALHVDSETGGYYVYTVTAMTVERKDVELIFEGDGYYLVSSGNRANSLREGNEIIVSGKDIYDGKVLE